jgi:hypothetical protein
MTDKTVTIKLQYPVEFADELIDEITLRRATGKDLRSMKGQNGVADSLALASRLSGCLPAVFDLMDAADVSAVLEEVGNLVAPGRATG